MSENDVADSIQRRQENNTGKLVIDTFYKLALLQDENGVSAQEIADYLHQKFGDVWNRNNLTEKAEECLKNCAALGYVVRVGIQYLADLGRRVGCSARRRRETQRRRRMGARRKYNCPRPRRRHACSCCRGPRRRSPGRIRRRRTYRRPVRG